MAEAEGDPGCGLVEAPQPRLENPPLQKTNNRTASMSQTSAALAGRLLHGAAALGRRAAAGGTASAVFVLGRRMGIGPISPHNAREYHQTA